VGDRETPPSAADTASAWRVKRTLNREFVVRLAVS
jgi:hypothetical protein